MSFSTSNIKYILAMYHLNKNNTGVRCVRIAELLNVTKPSVHKMMGILKEMGLIEKNSIGEVLFTREGLKLAERYDKYYHCISNVFQTYLSDEIDVSSVSCAILAEVPEKGLAKLYHQSQHRKI